MRRRANTNHKTIDVKHLRQTPSAGVVNTIEAYVYVADDIDWITVADNPIQKLRQVVKERRRDGLRARTVDDGDDRCEQSNCNPSTNELERSRVESRN